MAAALISAVVLAGVAYAAIPDSAGVFHACANRSNGALRVIDTSKGQSCASNEQAVSWNQTGPQGPVGPQGPTGATGAQGPAGSSGPLLAYAAAKTNERDTFNTNGTWVPIPGATLTLQVGTAPVVLDARFSTSAACFGTGRKYAEVIFDSGYTGGRDIGDPLNLAPYPLSDPVQEESTVTFETTMLITTPGPHTVWVQVRTEAGSSCVIAEHLWSLVVEEFSAV